MSEYRQISFADYAPGSLPRRRQCHPEGISMILRERVLSERSFEALDAKQALSALLTFAGCRDDDLSISSALFDRFGSLKGIFEARPEQLTNIPGLTARRAEFLSLLLPVVRLYQREQMQIPDRIGNGREAENYCLSLLSGSRNERFFVISLNAQCNILGARQISEGSIAEVSAYPRLVVETALNYNAHSVLLSHNHPGGTCAPSAEDIASTLQLQRLLNGIGILVLDHIIVAGDRTYSMIQHGDIDYRIKGR